MIKIKRFEEFVNENHSQGEKESGLIVKGTTPLDDQRIGEIVEEEGYYASWDEEGDYWFFPEEEATYNELEAELDKLFIEKGVSARFEGVFTNNENLVNEGVTEKDGFVFITGYPTLEEWRKAIKKETEGVSIDPSFEDCLDEVYIDSPKDSQFIYKKGDTPIKNLSVIWEMVARSSNPKENVKKGKEASERLEKRTEEIIQKNSDLQVKKFGSRLNLVRNNKHMIIRTLLFMEK